MNDLQVKVLVAVVALLAFAAVFFWAGLTQFDQCNPSATGSCR